MKSRKCKYCGERIAGKSIFRRDIAFCKESSSCRSKYHQAVKRGYRGADNSHLIHQEKEWAHPYNCVHCGNQFRVNDYAERRGKRVPKFCSNACKMKNYRARKKAEAKTYQKK